jgi:hypothetical protein
MQCSEVKVEEEKDQIRIKEVEEESNLSGDEGRD